MSTFFASQSMFKAHIERSELKQPSNFEDYDPEDYPQFHVFMLSHLGYPINIGDLEDNANIIANIPDEEIKSVTFEELARLGVVYGDRNNIV